MSTIKFYLRQAGTPEQHIHFAPSTGEPIDIPVPNSTFPEDGEPRFRALYAVLVSHGLVADNPVFNT